MPHHPYYIEKKYTHEFSFGTVNIPICQPTTNGVLILCQHYSEKYDIDLQCIDLIGKISNPENIFDFFSYLNIDQNLITLSNGKTRGLILMHGTHHAIPVLIHQRDEVRHILVFDSSSGSRVQGYFRSANLFSDAQTLFYLNSGTRQSDGDSCITDAICILKEALLITDLIALIENKIIQEHATLSPYQGPPGYKPLQLAGKIKPAHFRLFHMPEQLLLTAQRPLYVKEANADLSVILRGGRSLGDFREHYKVKFTLSNDEQDETYDINSFLFLKGAEYKEFLNYVYENRMENSEYKLSSTIESLDSSEIERITSPFKNSSGLHSILTRSTTRSETAEENSDLSCKNTSGFFPIQKIKQSITVRDTVLASPISHS